MTGLPESGRRCVQCDVAKVPILLQKSFCTGDQKFSRLSARLSCKDVGASSPEDKLTGDLGNAFEAAEIGGRWSDRLLAGKLSSGDFGLLQQYLPRAAVSRRSNAARYSMTSSARRRTGNGISTPIVLAALRLTTNSNLVGSSTGNSPGLVPFAMRSTNSAARRAMLAKLGP